MLYRCFISLFTQSGLLLLYTSFLLIGCQQANTLPDPLEAGWQGTKVCEVIQESEHVRALKCTFPPGVGHEKHRHKPHFGYALAGSKFQITDTTGIRTVDVPTGFSFNSEGIEWHEVLNVGDSTAIFLIVEPK